MGLDVSGLANYTEQNKMPLITKALFKAKTIAMLTPMLGVKSAETINVLDTDAVFQVGGTCGFSASGTTAITQRVLTIGKIKVQEALCPKTLEAKWTQILLQAGSTYDKVPFEQLYSEYKAELIAKQMEVAIWQGDTASGTGNLSKFDGLLKITDATLTAVDVNAFNGFGTVSVTSGAAAVTGVATLFTTQFAVGDKIKIGAGGAVYTISAIASATALTISTNASATVAAGTYKGIPLYSDGATASVSNPYFTTPVTTFDSTNAVSIMQSIYSVIPVEILDRTDVVIFMGMDFFRTWTNAITAANLFHYTADQSNNELVIPGTNIKVVAVNGLNGTSRIIASYLGNMYFGTDLMNEEEKFKIFFADEADEVRYMAEWKAGAQVAFPTLVLQFTLA